jgi:hypothetical protein
MKIRAGFAAIVTSLALMTAHVAGAETLIGGAAQALAETSLPPLGGSGGGDFTVRCPANQNLAGVRLRVGDDVDAIQPLCRTYTLSPYLEEETIYPTPESGARERTVERFKVELGSLQAPSDFIGGSGGGGVVDVLCKDDVVTGILVGDEGVYTQTVNRLGVFCDFDERSWTLDQSGNVTSCRYSSEARSKVIAESGGAGRSGWTLDPEDEFEGPKAHANEGFFSDDEVTKGEHDQHCPCGQVAVGITGRAGKWVDAVGLVCADLRSTKTMRAQGRVKLAPGATALPPMSICAAAKQARDRNSPAAPGLEAQCAAQAPLKAQGRVKLGGAASTSPALSICEAADAAIARNSPAARGLAQQCAAEKKKPLPPVDLNALQARGVEIANAEPEAGELRDQQGAVRRGFEIGLAAAEWQTLPGPGKDRIRAMLSGSTYSRSEQSAFDAAVAYSLALYKQKLAELATRGAGMIEEDALSAEFLGLQKGASAQLGFLVGLAAAEGQTANGPGKQKIRGALPAEEQAGYDTAVAFSIGRNSNPDFARQGMAVAQADPAVAAIRTREADALYRLGFDIATGLFGDAALGAAGHTSEGPGSTAIRNSLTESGKRGYDAAVKYHLSQ